MNLQVKYRGEKFNIDFKDGIYVLYKQMLLILKRIKRLGMRSGKAFLEEIVLIAIIILIYLIAISIIEVKFLNKTFLNAIWDTKGEILTALIIFSIQSIDNFRKKWRNEIKMWYWTYIEFLYKFTEDIKELCSAFDIEYTEHMLYTNDLFDEFYFKFRNEFKYIKKIDKNKIKNILNRIKEEANSLLFETREYELVEEKEEIRFLIYELNSMIIDINTEEIHNDEYIMLNIFQKLFEIMKSMRWTWRQDINIDKQIIEKIYKHNTEAGDNDCYYKLLLYKFEKE